MLPAGNLRPTLTPSESDLTFAAPEVVLSLAEARGAEGDGDWEGATPASDVFAVGQLLRWLRTQTTAEEVRERGSLPATVGLLCVRLHMRSPLKQCTRVEPPSCMVSAQLSRSPNPTWGDFQARFVHYAVLAKHGTSNVPDEHINRKAVGSYRHVFASQLMSNAISLLHGLSIEALGPGSVSDRKSVV